MGFGQEVKDFISAFSAGAGEVNQSQRISNERQMLNAQTDYMAARADYIRGKGVAPIPTEDPATTAGRDAQTGYSQRNPSAGANGKIDVNSSTIQQIKAGAVAAGKIAGVSPNDILTAVSYETGGTFNPWQGGPTTSKNGRSSTHIGLIQWGNQERSDYGITPNMSPYDQMVQVGNFLKDRGVKPGDGMLDIYSAINAGHAGLYNASDAGVGGAPGTVADKVNYQMAGHRANANLIMGADGTPSPTSSPSATGTQQAQTPQLAPPMPALQDTGTPIGGGSPVQQQAALPQLPMNQITPVDLTPVSTPQVGYSPQPAIPVNYYPQEQPV